MKMKKLISGIVAGALAVSALASMSFNASAEETTKVLWEGSLWMNNKGVDEPKNKGMDSVSLSILDGGESDTEGSNGIQVPAYWKSGSKLVIDFDAAATYKKAKSNGRSLNLGASIVGKLTDAWTWTQMDCYIKIDPSGNTYVVNDNDVVVDPDDEEFDQDYIDETLIPGITAEVELDEGGETGSGQIIVDLDSDADALDCGVNWYELITTMKEFDLKAADMTVKKISITGEYETPVFDQWNNNGDGSYTWTSSKGKITYDDSPEYLDGMNFDFANVLTIPSDAEVASISMDVAHSDWASVSLGVTQASDGEFAKTALSLNGTPSTESIVLEPEGGVAAGATPVFQCSFMNANCVLTISNFKVTLADGTEIVPGEDESSEADSSSEDESSEDASSEDASSEEETSSEESIADPEWVIEDGVYTLATNYPESQSVNVPLTLDADMLPIDDYSKVASISLIAKVYGTEYPFANVCIGANDAVNGWTQSDYCAVEDDEGVEVVLEFENGMEEGAEPYIQQSWFNAGTTLELSNITVNYVEDESSEVDTSSEDESSEDASSEDDSSEATDDSSSKFVPEIGGDFITGTGCAFYQVNADKTALRCVAKYPVSRIEKMLPDNIMHARVSIHQEDTYGWEYTTFDLTKAYRSIYVNGHKYTGDGDYLFFVTDSYTGFEEYDEIAYGFYSAWEKAWHAGIAYWYDIANGLD